MKTDNRAVWYVILARVSNNDWFITVRTPQQYHNGVLATEDAQALLDQLQRGKTAPFAFVDDNNIEVVLPMDYSVRLWFSANSSTMSEHKQRLAMPQSALIEVYNVS